VASGGSECLVRDLRITAAVNRSFLRREWGAITFVLTVLVGLIAVPIALILGNQSAAPLANAPVPNTPAPISAPSPASSPTPTPSPSVAASRTPTPTPSPSPTPR
jgi:hypothetical protein